MADALQAHFIGPDFKPAGEFSSSSAVLNAIQRSIVASAAANWANDVVSTQAIHPLLVNSRSFLRYCVWFQAEAQAQLSHSSTEYTEALRKHTRIV